MDLAFTPRTHLALRLLFFHLAAYDTGCTDLILDASVVSRKDLYAAIAAIRVPLVIIHRNDLLADRHRVWSTECFHQHVTHLTSGTAVQHQYAFICSIDCQPPITQTCRTLTIVRQPQPGLSRESDG